MVERPSEIIQIFLVYCAKKIVIVSQIFTHKLADTNTSAAEILDSGIVTCCITGRKMGLIILCSIRISGVFKQGAMCGAIGR